MYTGQSASPTTSIDQEPNNHYCLTQSAPDAFASLVTSAELTPVRIMLGHCTPVLLACRSTGGEDPAGRRQTWLRTIENDLRPLNLGLATAQRRAQNRTTWQTLVETATSLTSDEKNPTLSNPPMTMLWQTVAID